MNFAKIADLRHSCRKYDTDRPVEDEKILAVLEAGRLAPSACNGQPYHFTVCKGDLAKEVALTTKSMGINNFADQAPVLIIISEQPYVKTAALGAKIKDNDYRSMDIGIAAAYMTAEATVQGLGSCILGWLDSDKIQALCGIEDKVRLIITLGYSAEESVRPKKRKTMEELVTIL